MLETSSHRFLVNNRHCQHEPAMGWIRERERGNEEYWHWPYSFLSDLPLPQGLYGLRLLPHSWEAHSLTIIKWLWHCSILAVTNGQLLMPGWCVEPIKQQFSLSGVGHLMALCTSQNAKFTGFAWLFNCHSTVTDRIRVELLISWFFHPFFCWKVHVSVGDCAHGVSGG